jgi:hypothetical protein
VITQTVEGFHAITAPTLIRVGDRSPFCSVEEAVSVCRALREGEFAVLPNTVMGSPSRRGGNGPVLPAPRRRGA